MVAQSTEPGAHDKNARPFTITLLLTITISLGRMAIVLESFILAVQEILDLLYYIRSHWLDVLSNYKMIAYSVEFLSNCKKMRPSGVRVVEINNKFLMYFCGEKYNKYNV